MKPIFTKTIALLALLLAAVPAQAHFPWLATDPDGKVLYFFGEDPSDRTYDLPPAIAKAKIQFVGEGPELHELKMEAIDSDKFVGMRSSEAVKPGTTLRTQITYGIYKGSRLDYYTIHRSGPLPKELEAYESEPALALNVYLVATDSGVDVYVLLKGKPLADAEVKLFSEDGSEEGEANTNKDGKVSFTNDQVKAGLNGIMVGHNAEDEKGEIEGKAYESASHYLTATFVK